MLIIQILSQDDHGARVSVAVTFVFTQHFFVQMVALVEMKTLLLETMRKVVDGMLAMRIWSCLLIWCVTLK